MATRIKFVSKYDLHEIHALADTQELPKTNVKVVASTDGPVTLRQKIAAYYQQLILIVGGTLSFLTYEQKLGFVLPDNINHWLAIFTGGLTLVLAFLKENQHWVDDATVL